MSDPNAPVELPPDLPPEYAEAYRRGFERAIAEASTAPQLESEPGYEPVPTPETGSDTSPEPTPERAQDEEPARDPEPVQEPPAEQEPEGDYEYLYGASSTSVNHLPEEAVQEPADDSADWLLTEPVGAIDWDTPMHRDHGPARRPAWFVPAILAGLAVVLLVAAYGLGKMVSHRVSTGHGATSSSGLAGVGGSTSAASLSSQQSPGKAYGGALVAVVPTAAHASCQAPDGEDSAGRKISYQPSNVYDSDTSTAWRCYGDGVGDTITLVLPHRMKIGEVGLIPGYAKTDPDSGTDRYAQNSRLTEVRWTFGKTNIVQHLDASPTNRRMQTMRIPLASARRVTITILSSSRGVRNTVAISEVVVARGKG